jgi:serine/threonine protein kinase
VLERLCEKGDHLNKAQLNPGLRYIVREPIGRGRWKEVYRAVVRGEWHDRALARFIEAPDGVEFFDEIRLLLDPERGQLENVAQLYRAFKGDDGHLYLEEELLYRPLEALAPLKMVDRFFRIARDLCKGLASLHSHNWVHRDLKLDNCGIDHSGTAKIFDLGSVTSEGGTVKGTTLTRAPELFVADAKCTKASDVWAMGAVLFALRTGGDYPFVTKGEARTRPPNGEARKHFDLMAQERASDPNGETHLRTRIGEEFPNGSGVLISNMLSFDPDKRPTAAECAERWGDLLRPWIPAQQVESVDVEKRVFQDIVAYLNAVLRGSAAMSSFQWARVLTAMEKIEPKLDPAQTSTWNELRNKIAVMRESVAV